MVVRSEGIAATAPARTDVVFDPAAGEFVRVTTDSAGRVLARADLDPSEKRATLRTLFATRTTRVQRDAFVRAIDRIGLIVVLASRSGRPASTEELTDVVSEARDRREIQEFAQRMEASIAGLLTLIWAVNFSVCPPGQALPRLEAINADFPYVPAVGVACPPPGFDAQEALRESDHASEVPAGFDFR